MSYIVKFVESIDFMLFFRSLILILALGSLMVLSACGSRSSNGSYAREDSRITSSARMPNQLNVGRNYQTQNAGLSTVGMPQQGSIEIRSDVATLPCETLVLEDQKITSMGQAIDPTYEDMMRQLRLLEVRAALYARCNRPSASAVPQQPQFTVPIQEAMNAQQIEESRRMYAATQVQHVQQIQRPQLVRSAPPEIETRNEINQPTLAEVPAPKVTVSAPAAEFGTYKTIQKVGDSTRVHYVSYADLPIIAGPELMAK